MRRILSAAAVALTLGPAIAAQDPPPPPPAPGSIQRELDAKYKALMAGEWTITWNEMGARRTLKALYRPDGSLIGTLTVEQYTSIDYPMKGTWSVMGYDDKSFILTTSVPGSGNANDTLTVIDDNTLFSKNLQESLYRLN